MTHYPLFLDLSRKHVLVVGFGEVGRRKIVSLLKAGPGRLTVVDPALDDSGRSEFSSERIVWLARPFEAGDIEGRHLVFAATNDLALNAAVAKICAGRGVLCNCAAPPDAGDCLAPAHFDKDGLTVALSSGGHSPALVRELRQELEAFVASRYSPLLRVMARLRPLILDLGLPSTRNRDVFRMLVTSPLAGHLASGEKDRAESLLRELLPEKLRARVGEVLHGI
ncbi:MAG: bifunctional precorrin-2 dehydrogenase/sirohydrochlorin ferrochelatase [Desulfovibrio sp.]|jgi:precorrin-2 dehydrogenase/sirohydrochlorin ferrochelatase|nr:bifunctional precorrin-2 dehydrogenase/sirohydrochlorin ferrochelatase [Desulfovibrio sp.]